VEAGSRASLQEADVWQVVAGLEGVFRNGWEWDLSLNHAEYDERLVETGRALNSRVDEVLDPDACTANPDCPGLWNIFAPGSLTPALLDYVSHDPVENRRSEMQVIQANLRGDIPALVLPGGTVEWAAGLEHRREEAESVPDPLAIAGEVFFFPAGISRGDYHVNEAYGELHLPLLRNAPWAKLLAVEASVRWSDYDFLDSGETNAKFGLEWAPVEDLRLRAIYTEGFRAPNIAERFDPAIPSAEDYADPCAFYSDPGTDPVVAANCASELLPADFEGGPQGQAVSLIRGNQELEPEEAENLTLGLIWTPSMLPGLVVTLDWFDIEIEGAIGSAGAQNIINLCYRSPGFSSPYCDLLRGPGFVDETPHGTSPYRNVAGDISGVDLINGNFQVFNTSGVDFTVAWGFNVAGGRIDLDLSGTWLDTYEFQTAAGGPVLRYAGKFASDPYFGSPAAFPEWQGRFAAAFRRDDWGASWIIRYMDGVSDLTPDSGELDTATPTIIYHDVQAYRTLGPVTLTGGVRNLFDKDPPYVPPMTTATRCRPATT
jgi:iron complex outermembrane receptor protein